jgi:hypothetical protein
VYAGCSSKRTLVVSRASPAVSGPQAVEGEQSKGFFDLGDIAALVDPGLACWEETECPEVDWDLNYQFKGKLGSILRCYHVDRDRTFGLLYDRLKEAYG